MRKRRWRDEREPVELACEKRLRSTSMAIQYKLIDGREVWLPKSAVHDEDIMDDGTCVIHVSAWLAEKEGLE